MTEVRPRWACNILLLKLKQQKQDGYPAASPASAETVRWCSGLEQIAGYGFSGKMDLRPPGTAGVSD